MSNEISLNRIRTPQDVNSVDTVESPQTPVKGHDSLPAMGAAQQPKDISKLLSLPELNAPTGPLDLDSLMKSLNFEQRRSACRQGLESIAANAKDQKAENDKAIAKMKENIEKMDEARKLQEMMKILSIFALVVAAVVTVATLGTAGPVMACISIALLALTVVSFATDGKVSIAAGFAKLGKECGMSEEDSKLFGTIMEIVVIIATLGVGIGCSLSKGAATAGAQVAKGAQTAAKTAEAAITETSTTLAKETTKKLVSNLDKLAAQATKNTFKLTQGLVEASKAAKDAGLAVAKEAGTVAGGFATMPANTAWAIVKEGLKVLLPASAKKAALITQIVGTVGTGATLITKGGLGIKAADVESDAVRIKANVKQLEALLLRLREFSDFERVMVKSEMERCNALMDSVMKIVHGNNDAQMRILGNTPSMA